VVSMGNSTSFSPAGKGLTRGEAGGQKKDASNIDSQLPPLLILKDAGVQTYVSYGNRRFRFGSLLSIAVVLCSFLYAALVYAFATSVYLQSVLLYLNILNFPFGDLTNVERFGLSMARNINVTTSDGILLRGWHLLPAGSDAIEAASLPMDSRSREDFFDQKMASADRIMLYFHGNAANRAFPYRVDLAQRLAAQLSAHVVVIDYRGFGDSEGWPSEEGTHLDALATVKWVSDTVRKGNPYSVGYLGENVQCSFAGCVAYWSSSLPDEYIPASVTDNLDAGAEQADSGDGVKYDEFDEGDPGDLGSRRKPKPAQKGNSKAKAKGKAKAKSTAGGKVENRGKDASFTNTKETQEDDSHRNLVIKQPELFIYGHSLGTAIGTNLAVDLSRKQPGSVTGLILDSPFTTILDAAMSHPSAAIFRIFPYIQQFM
jgi:hypothetical protein